MESTDTQNIQAVHTKDSVNNLTVKAMVDKN